MRTFTLLSALALAPALMSASASDSPEPVIRSFMMAMYAADKAAVQKLTLTDPRREEFLAGIKPDAAGSRELQEDPDRLQLRQSRPFQHRGLDITAESPDAKGGYPAGTTALYIVAYRGGPIPVSVVKQADGWKIDLRWWVRMKDLATIGPPKEGTPDHAARAFTAALIRLDRKAVTRLAHPDANMEILFAGAPTQREPSGHLDALVGEMPIVEIGPGEFSQLPSGRSIEGVQREDMKVLVGLFGPVEIPFILRRVKAEWRVAAEPYFLLLMR
jgi:hypothetical protein